MSALIIALLVIGVGLLVAEAHVVSYGVLGVAGTAALCAGAALAIDAAGMGLAAALGLAAVIALVAATAIAMAGVRVHAVHRRRALGGSEGLIGRVGVLRSDLAPCGDVCVRGELWRAERSLVEEEDVALVAGDHVVVDRVRGLTVSVRRAEEWEVRP